MDSIKRIISADEALRQSAAGLDERRSQLENDIASEKQQLKLELFTKADARISQIMRDKRSRAENQWKESSLKYEHIGENLDKIYKENRDAWAKMIFDRVISESDI